MDRGVYGGRGRRVRDLEVDDFIRQPFLESRDAFSQVSSCLVFRIRYGEHRDVGEGMLEDSLEVRREVS